MLAVLRGEVSIVVAARREDISAVSIFGVALPVPCRRSGRRPSGALGGPRAGSGSLKV